MRVAPVGASAGAVWFGVEAIMKSALIGDARANRAAHGLHIPSQTRNGSARYAAKKPVHQITTEVQ